MNEESKYICRVCLHVDILKYPSLFEQSNDCLIADKINSIANVGICLGDGLPDRICPQCLLELENAIHFKIKCEDSNTLLRTAEEKKEDDFKYELEDNIQNEEQQEDDHHSQELRSDEILQNTLKHDEYVESLTLIKEEEDFEPHKEGLEDNLQENDHQKKDLQTQEVFSDVCSDKLNQEVRKSRAIDLKLECHDCGGFFKSKCKLCVHWKTAHKPKIICNVCKKIFKSYSAYHIHNKNRENTCLNSTNVCIEGEGKSRIFHCKECDYKSKKLFRMKIHLVIHTSERPFKCDKCTRCFTQCSSLQAHKEVSHKEYRVEITCQHCGKYLQGRGKIYTHMLSHRPKTVQCDICKTFFRSKQSLEAHMLRHMGIRSYTCEFCALRFYTNSELHNHQIRHDRNISKKCDICGYKARRTQTINIHKAKHTATNHPCMECGIFVKTAQLLAVHMKRHLDRSYACPYCDMNYHTRHSRSLHVRQKHKYTMLGNFKTKTPHMK